MNFKDLEEARDFLVANAQNFGYAISDAQRGGIRYFAGQQNADIPVVGGGGGNLLTFDLNNLVNNITAVNNGVVSRVGLFYGNFEFQLTTGALAAGPVNYSTYSVLQMADGTQRRQYISANVDNNTLTALKNDFYKTSQPTFFNFIQLGININGATCTISANLRFNGYSLYV